MLSTKASNRAFQVGNGIFLLLVFLVAVYPFLYVVAVSLSDPYAVMQNKVFLLPVGFSFSSYKTVLSNPSIWSGYKNTLLYTGVGTLMNLFFTSTMAYALSKRQLFGRRVFSLMVIFTMFFQGGMIPMYILVCNLRLINTLWAVILPTVISTWNLMVMRTFFESLPSELEDAAMVDGCNPLAVFARIILPLSSPIMLTMALFYAVGHWNSYFAPFIYLNDRAKYPLQITVKQIVISGETSFANYTNVLDQEEVIIATTVKYATIVVSILPIVTLYPFMQKYFVKGVMIGSVKG